MKKLIKILCVTFVFTMIVGCAHQKNGESATKSSEKSPKQNESTHEKSETNNDISEETVSSTEKFNVKNYLNENYKMKNTHYQTKSWENADTGKTNYTVKMVPETKEYSQDIEAKFCKGNTAIYEETQNLFYTAKDIMIDLPKVNDQVHIDSVNWVSYNGDFSVMLIQDYEHSGGGDTGNKVLSQYSSKQIEYARVWLQLGANQKIDELNVLHIKAGTPINPTDDTSANYPRDVIQLAGSRLVDGSVTYSGNGDGTINVYNVPLRWDGEYPAGKQFYKNIIQNTKLVYVDPGDDDKIVELIKLLHVHN